MNQANKYPQTPTGAVHPPKDILSILRSQQQPDSAMSPSYNSPSRGLDNNPLDGREVGLIGYGTPSHPAVSQNSTPTTPGMRIHNLQSPAPNIQEKMPPNTPTRLVERQQHVAYIPQTPPRSNPSSMSHQGRRPPLRNSLTPERRNPPGLLPGDRGSKLPAEIPSPKTDPTVDLEHLKVLSMPAKPPLPEPLLSTLHGTLESNIIESMLTEFEVPMIGTKIPRLSRPAPIRTTLTPTTHVPHPARQDRHERSVCPPGLRNPSQTHLGHEFVDHLQQKQAPQITAEMEALAKIPSPVAKKSQLTPPKPQQPLGKNSHPSPSGSWNQSPSQQTVTTNGATPSTDTPPATPKKSRRRNDDNTSRRRRGERNRGGTRRQGTEQDDAENNSGKSRGGGRSRRDRGGSERKPPKPAAERRKPIPMVSSATRERRLKQQQSKEKKLRQQNGNDNPAPLTSSKRRDTERGTREPRKRGGGNRSEKRDRGGKRGDRSNKQSKSNETAARSQPPRRGRDRDKPPSRSTGRPPNTRPEPSHSAAPIRGKKTAKTPIPRDNVTERPARVSDPGSDDDGPAAVDATPRQVKKLNISPPRPKKKEPEKKKASPSTNQFAMLMMDQGDSSSDENASDAEIVLPDAKKHVCKPCPPGQEEEPCVVCQTSPKQTQEALDALRAIDGSMSIDGKPNSINPRIWKRSAIEEKEQIKRFWHALTKRERGHLVKVSKNSILNLLAKQQRIVCTCSVCQRRRRLVSEEIAELYDTFYWELDEVDRHTGPMGPDVPDLSRWSNTDADLSVRVRAGVMTINDELLKQEGKMFLEMMEKVAEQKLHQKETSDASTCSMDRPLTSLVETGQRQETRCRRVPYRDGPLGDWGDEDGEDGPEMSSEHSYVPEHFEERADDVEANEEPRAPLPKSPAAVNPDGEASEPSPLPPGSESGEPYDYEEEQYSASDTEMAEIDAEGRLEEARRLFGLFAAKLFHQRVFNAYLEQICSQRQEELIRELEEEEARKMRRKLKKKLKRFKRKERHSKRK